MAIQSAQAKIYTYFETAVFGLRILSSDVFELGESPNQIVVTQTTIPYKIVRFTPNLTATSTVVLDRIAQDELGNYLPGTYIAGFLNKSSLRSNSPTTDTFYNNVELSTAQDNYGINLIARSSLTLRMPTTISIDLSKVVFPVSPMATYTVALSEDFFTEQFNNQMPSPAIPALTTITAPNRPIIRAYSPFNGQTGVNENTKIVLEVNVQDAPSALTRGAGFFRVYRDGSLVASLNVLDGSKVSISGNKITLNVLGLIDADKDYYVLIDNGVVSSVDGFLSQVVSSSTAISYSTSPSTETQFPDLISLVMAAGNMYVPQTETLQLATAVLSDDLSRIERCILERVRLASGTTNSSASLNSTVSALVFGSANLGTASSTLTAALTYNVGEIKSNMLVQSSLDFYIKLEPTTISSQFAVVKADISVRKPAEFRLNAAFTMPPVLGGKVKGFVAPLGSVSSFSCSQVDTLPKAMVIFFNNTDNNQVVGVKLGGTVNATIQWGGGGHSQSPQGPFSVIPRDYANGTGWYPSGGGKKTTQSVNAPGTYSINQGAQWTGSGVLYPGNSTTYYWKQSTEYDGYVIIKGTVTEFLGFVTSNQYVYPQIRSFGELGITKLSRLPATNVNSTLEGSRAVSIFTSQLPSTVTDLTKAFAHGAVKNPTLPTPTYLSNYNSVVGDFYRLSYERYYNQNNKTITQTVGAWDTSNVTTLYGTFNDNRNNAYATPQGGDYTLDLTAWNTANVSDIRYCFAGSAYNNITGVGNWNVANVTQSYQVFGTSLPAPSGEFGSDYTAASNFNQPLANWNVASWTDFSYLFYSNTAFNQSLNSWNTANATTFEGMFQNASAFNGNISSWNTGNALSMKLMFSGAKAFNGNISGWNVSNVRNFESMFNGFGAADDMLFNQNIGSWNTGNATTMKYMFLGCRNFNQPIGSWNVSNVTNMDLMFGLCYAFNQSLASWNTGNVTSMASMFSGGNRSGVTTRTNFNQPIGGWNVSKVTNMSGMFQYSRFNQQINTWNTSALTNVGYMFYENNAFNQTLVGWNVSNITNIDQMFYNATAYNQNLSSINFTNISGNYGSYLFRTGANAWLLPKPTLDGTPL